MKVVSTKDVRANQVVQRTGVNPMGDRCSNTEYWGERILSTANTIGLRANFFLGAGDWVIFVAYARLNVVVSR